LWDVATGKEIQSFQGHADNVSSVAISADGTHVVTGSWDRTAKLWAVSPRCQPLAGAAQKIIRERNMCLTPAQREKYFLTGPIKNACDGGVAPEPRDWVAALFEPLRPLSQALAPRLGDACH
jgi:WD40 repeat protein